jgi:DNA polymerase III delta prime subunit
MSYLTFCTTQPSYIKCLVIAIKKYLTCLFISVLFHGPPGTGKTLLARALAAECSQEGRKVAFFMRKGADCLNKWIGESERQLRLLFDQAYVSFGLNGPFDNQNHPDIGCSL